MGLGNWLKRSEGRYAWSLLGFMLAVIFGGVTLYTEFIRDVRPVLRFEVLSDAPVLDVRERLPELTVLYSGTDITKTGQALRMVVLRVTNDGAQDILKSYYDDAAPLGVRLDKSSLLQAQLLDASNEYLRSRLILEVHGTTSVTFSPVILAAGQSFTIKALLLHSVSERPSVVPIGTVAGVRAIELIDSSGIAPPPPFTERLLYGSPLVQICRAIIYPLGVIAFVVLIAFTVDAVTTGRRRWVIRRFKNAFSGSLNGTEEPLFKEYRSSGREGIRALHASMVDEAALLTDIRELSKGSRFQNHVYWDPVSQGLTLHQARISTKGGRSGYPPTYVAHRGLVKQVDDKWIVDKHLKDVLAKFNDFLS